jgi:hypothetical protein
MPLHLPILQSDSFIPTEDAAATYQRLFDRVMSLMPSKSETPGWLLGLEEKGLVLGLMF